MPFPISLPKWSTRPSKAGMRAAPRIRLGGESPVHPLPQELMRYIMLSLTRSFVLSGLFGILTLGLLVGCGSSEPRGPVVGADIEKQVYLVRGQNVDQPPEIIGGYQEVERLKRYPESAAEDSAYGVIWLQSTISASGSATRIQVAEGGHPSLETEALNVMQQLRFRPAQINGGGVQAKIQLPIIFQGPYASSRRQRGG